MKSRVAMWLKLGEAMGTVMSEEMKASQLQVKSLQNVMLPSELMLHLFSCYGTL
jgi:hypothetical protein